MKPVTRRILFSLAILVWSGAMLYFHASGRINQYLAPDFRPIALLGGLGLAVLGGFNLITARHSADGGDDHPENDGSCSHDHSSPDIHPLAALLLMILPLGFSVAWTKDEYSPATLTRKGLYDSPSPGNTSFLAQKIPPFTLEEIERTHSRSIDGFYQFNLMELFYASGDREMQSVLDGLQVETEGRWMDDKSTGGTRKRLYRLFVTCCAADSRAIPIVLEFGATPPDYPENSWVSVAGVMTFPMEDGVMHPVLKVERALAADPPSEESFLRK